MASLQLNLWTNFTYRCQIFTLILQTFLSIMLCVHVCFMQHTVCVCICACVRVRACVCYSYSPSVLVLSSSSSDCIKWVVWWSSSTPSIPNNAKFIKQQRHNQWCLCIIFHLLTIFKSIIFRNHTLIIRNIWMPGT